MSVSRPIQFIHPEWAEHPNVKRAAEAAGWPDCTVVDVLEALSEIIEKSLEYQPEIHQRLFEEYGLTTGELVDMAAQVAAAEGPARCRDRVEADGFLAPRNRRQSEPQSAEARDVIRNLFLHGLTEEQIHRILEPSGLSLGEVQDYIANHNMATTSQEVVRLHREGLTATEIARRLQYGKGNVYAILHELGLQPNVKRTMLSRSVRDRIVQLRNEGKSQPEICEALDVTPTQIKNTLRLAASKGMVQNYGARRRQAVPA